MRMMNRIGKHISEIEYMRVQWDSNLNKDSMNEVWSSSQKKYHWLCQKCGYSWTASPSSRLHSTGKCPCCERKTVFKSGVNDVVTLVPEIMTIYDYEANKNLDYDIHDQRVSSTKIFYWKCDECGRRWKTVLSARIKRTATGYQINKCPHYNTCRRTKAETPSVFDNKNLYQIWDSKKNTENPKNILENSPDEYYWHCNSCGYSWKKKVAVEDGRCPCCVKHQVLIKGKSDIFTLIPGTAKYYDWEKNKGIDPYTLYLSTNVRLDWKCPDCGFAWKTRLFYHVNKIQKGKYEFKGCDRCKGINQKWKISEVPKLMKLWDYEKNDSIGIRPDKYTVHTKNLRVFWRCPDCNYEWDSLVKSRYISNISCPACAGIKENVTKGVDDILTILPKIADYFDWERNKNIDIYAVGINAKSRVYWKCDKCGRKWENDFQSMIERNSDGSLEVAGCRRCRLRFFTKNTYADDYPELVKIHNDSLSGHSLAELKAADIYKKTEFWNCKKCGETYCTSLHSMIDALRNNRLGCPYCNSKILRKGMSFGDIHPELMDEYSPENTIDPYKTFPAARAVVKWICKVNPQHIWTASFGTRHDGLGKCPFCNKFSDLHPDLAEEIDFIATYPIANPDETGRGSRNQFWWICKNNPLHKYHMTPENRIVFKNRNKNPCPYCKGLRQPKSHFI